jgi:hypothetical protein
MITNAGGMKLYSKPGLVALEALHGVKSIQQIASEYEMHSVQVLDHFNFLFSQFLF